MAGQDIAHLDVAHICRRVGYLPQDPNALLFADSVLEELMITLRNHGLLTRRGDLPADSPISPQRLLKRLGLAEKVDHYPRDLSVGERQRMADGGGQPEVPRLIICRTFSISYRLPYHLPAGIIIGNLSSSQKYQQV